MFISPRFANSGAVQMEPHRRSRWNDARTEENQSTLVAEHSNCEPVQSGVRHKCEEIAAFLKGDLWISFCKSLRVIAKNGSQRSRALNFRCRASGKTELSARRIIFFNRWALARLARSMTLKKSRPPGLSQSWKRLQISSVTGHPWPNIPSE